MAESSLVKYNEACRALVAAKAVDEVLDIRDKAEALSVYARLAKNTQMELDAVEIRIRAERRIGEMMAEQKATVGMAKPPGKKIGSQKDPISTAPTLADVGIDKHLADRARKLAAMKAPQFEKQVTQWREYSEKKEGCIEKNILKPKAHVANNSGENEWYTPTAYIEAARVAMGSIDVDPASSDVANKTVKAKKFYTEETDGLTKKWTGNVWMNPPYAQPLIKHFCDTFCDKVESGEIKHGIVLVNNITETITGQKLMNASNAVCFPAGRIQFLDKEGSPKGAPLQGQMILYFGDNTNDFEIQFKQFGICYKR